MRPLMARAAHAVEVGAAWARVGDPGSDWRGPWRRELHRDARVPRRDRLAGAAGRRDLVGPRTAAASRVPRSARTIRRTCTGASSPHSSRDAGALAALDRLRRAAAAARDAPAAGDLGRARAGDVREHGGAGGAPSGTGERRGARRHRAGPLARGVGLEGERRRRGWRVADAAGRTLRRRDAGALVGGRERRRGGVARRPDAPVAGRAVRVWEDPSPDGCPDLNWQL